MIKVYLKASASDGQYVFGPDLKSYANTFKVGESDGLDVVMVATDDSEGDYLAKCENYLGTEEMLFKAFPEIIINQVRLAGEEISVNDIGDDI